MDFFVNGIAHGTPDSPRIGGWPPLYASRPTRASRPPPMGAWLRYYGGLSSVSWQLFPPWMRYFVLGRVQCMYNVALEAQNQNQQQRKHTRMFYHHSTNSGDETWSHTSRLVFVWKWGEPRERVAPLFAYGNCGIYYFRLMCVSACRESMNAGWLVGRSVSGRVIRSCY